MVYYFNKITREYCGTKEPIGENFDYTMVAPPQLNKSQSVFFNTEDGVWEIVECSIKEQEDTRSEEDILAEIHSLTIRIQEHILMDEKEEARELVLEKRQLEEELNVKQHKAETP